VLLGWTVTRCRPLLRTLHIISVIYAIVIEFVPWPPCPLTVAETWLEARAGIEPSHGPFLVRVLDAIVYPNLPTWAVVGGAVLVCLGILESWWCTCGAIFAGVRPAFGDDALLWRMVTQNWGIAANRSQRIEHSLHLVPKDVRRLAADR
jgi:Protein of Unknown function (DUF2784)